MPELPEVETTRRGILPHVQQQTVVKVVVRHHQLRWPIPQNIHRQLVGQTIVQIERRAKYLLLKTQKGTLIIHLGMSGHLRVVSEAVAPAKHDHVDIVFAHKKILRFNDPRRFGAILWVEGDPHQYWLLNKLGVEPLTKAFSAQYLRRRAQGKRVAIKSLLMDNTVVTGIGNIYATEALFEVGIYPAASAQSVSIEHLHRLTLSIKKILRQAIRRGGTTLKDFMNSEGKPGYFSTQLKVYGRAGLACVRCHAALQSMKIGQRSTVYCEHCQCDPPLSAI